MRVVGIIVLLLLLPSVYAGTYTYGCCLPQGGDCIKGDTSVFIGTNGEATFINACTNAGGTVNHDTTYCQNQCSTGCCCAGTSVRGYLAINNDESQLKMTPWLCGQQQGFTMKALPAGKTCVEVCAPTGTTQPPTTYTLQGTVKRGATTPLPASAVTLYVPNAAERTMQTDSQGKYSFAGLPAQNYIVKAVPPADAANCKPQYVNVYVNANKVQDFTIDCTATVGCTNTKPTITGLAVVKGTDDVTFTINYANTCSNLKGYVPVRIEKIGTQSYETVLPWVPGVPGATPTVTDSGLKPKTTYIYYVRAQNDGGADAVSSIYTITTGDLECMQSNADRWCGTTSTGTPAILSCDSSNKLFTSACTGAQQCVLSGTTPTCAELPACNKCNGLLGLFGKLGLKVSVGTTLPRLFTCGVDTNTICYNDTQSAGKPTQVTAYSSCRDAKNCSAYQSEGACLKNSCGFSQCEWKSLVPELGKGICLTKNAVPPCKQCDDVLGYCNKDLCEKISADCYYATPPGYDLLEKCLPRQEMACRLYNNQNDCTGGTNAAYSIVYDGESRKAGDNSHTNSKDRFLFTACAWTGDRCIKDADNFTLEHEDDCVEDGLQDQALMDCMLDMTPPVTTLVLKPPVNGWSLYGSSEINGLPMSASDDRSPQSDIRTYVCLRNMTANDPLCYPKRSLSTVPIGDITADYELRYYSIDGHHNSEVIKTAKLRVHKDDVPRLTAVEIRES